MTDCLWSTGPEPQNLRHLALSRGPGSENPGQEAWARGSGPKGLGQRTCVRGRWDLGKRAWGPGLRSLGQKGLGEGAGPKSLKGVWTNKQINQYLLLSIDYFSLVLLQKNESGKGNCCPLNSFFGTGYLYHH